MHRQSFYNVVDHEIGKLYFLNYFCDSNLNKIKECVLMYIGKHIENWCCEHPICGCRIVTSGKYKSQQKKFVDLKANEVYYLLYCQETQVFNLCLIRDSYAEEVYSFHAPIKSFEIVEEKR